jgi:hypothetical protein
MLILVACSVKGKLARGNSHHCLYCPVYVETLLEKLQNLQEECYKDRHWLKKALIAKNLTSEGQSLPLRFT